jgi:predicted adenine nucleotide alpha hydrolase (AANH) superfamily ATPase
MKPPARHLLLHVCCGPCGTAALERLLRQGEVTLFFSNGNLFPAEEYERRLAAVRTLAAECGVSLVVDTYDHASWQAWVAGLETEPERGARCRKCFEFSLRRAAEYARAGGFDALTTTLTISPHKDSQTVFAAGRAATDRFLEVDFKQDHGFRRSLELSRRHGLYRQDYCGCEFSLAERDRRRRGQRT